MVIYKRSLGVCDAAAVRAIHVGVDVFITMFPILKVDKLE